MGIRDQLLSRKTEQVPLADGSLVTVQELSVGDFLTAYESGEEEIQFALVAAAVVDESGLPALSLAEAKAIPRNLFKALLDAAMRLNKQETVEAIQKN